MYAILQHGGHQYRVTAGDRLLVDRLPAEVGDTVSLEPVLFIADGEKATSEAAALRGASVTAVVVAHRRGHKVRVFSYKPKKRHRRTLGYRSQLTELRVEAVVPPKTEARAKQPKAEAPAKQPQGEAPAKQPRAKATTARPRAEVAKAAEAAPKTEAAPKPARKPTARRKPADGA
jgi:large subunit ribosomal protein L21